MTIEQANQYFAALPDGFASTEQLRAALTAPVGKVAFVGVAGTAGKTVVARLLAAVLHAQGIHAGLYHAGCEPLAKRIRIDDAPVDEGLLALTADALAAAEPLPQEAAELAGAPDAPKPVREPASTAPASRRANLWFSFMMIYLEVSILQKRL